MPTRTSESEIKMEELEALFRDFSLEDNRFDGASPDVATEDANDVTAHYRSALNYLQTGQWNEYQKALDLAETLKNEDSSFSEDFKGKLDEWAKEAARYCKRLSKCEEKLGSGTFGDVFKGYDKVAEESVAIKKIKFSTKGNKAIIKEVRKAMEEVNVWKRLNHPFIVKLRDSFVWTGNVRIVMDLRDAGTLENYIESLDEKKCSEQETRIVAKQLFLTLYYLNIHNVVSHLELFF